MEGKHLEREVEGVPHAELLMLSVFPNTSIQLMRMQNESQSMPKELQQVVDQYDDVFAILKELPLHRSFDHIISLLEGTQLDNYVEYLGHVILVEGVSTKPNKVKAMQYCPIPSTLKQLRGFLGLTGYYRSIKESYDGSTSIGLIDFDEPFVIDIDASGVGLGAVLQQKGHPIA
ncbi:hypothetical protein Tco_1099721 [Tanacetum coccineum]